MGICDVSWQWPSGNINSCFICLVNIVPTFHISFDNASSMPSGCQLPDATRWIVTPHDALSRVRRDILMSFEGELIRLRPLRCKETLLKATTDTIVASYVDKNITYSIEQKLLCVNTTSGYGDYFEDVWGGNRVGFRPPLGWLHRQTFGINVYPSGTLTVSPLLWRHNGDECVSNCQPHDCLLNRLFGRWSKKTSKLRVTGLCAGLRWIPRTNGQ